MLQPELFRATQSDVLSPGGSSVNLTICHDLIVRALFRCQGREVSCRMGSDERPIVPSADDFLALCFNKFQLGQLGGPRERVPELGRNADASGGKLSFFTV